MMFVISLDDVCRDGMKWIALANARLKTMPKHQHISALRSGPEETKAQGTTSYSAISYSAIQHSVGDIKCAALWVFLSVYLKMRCDILHWGFTACRREKYALPWYRVDESV